MLRLLRWLLFLAALAFLTRAVFIDPSARSVGGAAACGGVWYWLGRRKLKSLDAPKPWKS